MTDDIPVIPCTPLKSGTASVVALILNWNLWEMTIECIESLEKSDFGRLGILVVDNGSDNDSAQRIQKYIESISRQKGRGAVGSVVFLRSEENLGYSGGNNLGMRTILSGVPPDFILLLNNDVVVAPDAVRLLLEHAVVNEDFVFLGPKILFYDNPSRIQTKGVMLSKNILSIHHVGFGDSDRPDDAGVIEVDALYGACLLVRTRCLKELGGLDEVFRFYSEDIEWCMRASRRGLKAGCVPSARVWHRSEASTRRFGAYMRYHNGRGRAIVLRRYASPPMTLASLVLWLPRELGRIVHSDRSVSPAIWYMRGLLSAYLEDVNDPARGSARLLPETVGE